MIQMSKQVRSGQQSKAAAMQSSPMNVEQLNDTIAQHSGKQVSVAGEIEEWPDSRSFVLESVDRITRQHQEREPPRPSWP